MASDAQYIINLSLKKILLSRSKRGGIDLHRNLLLASVLLRARDVCLSVSSVDSSSFQNNPTRELYKSPSTTEPEMVDDERYAQTYSSLSADPVPNCEDEDEDSRALSSPSSSSSSSSSDGSWDEIPDQALEEWNFLGVDICSDQMDQSNLEDSRQPEGEPSVLQIHSLDLQKHNRSCEHATPYPRKRTLDELETLLHHGQDQGEQLDLVEQDHTSRPFKKARTDPTVNCDMEFLTNSVVGDCSLENLNTSLGLGGEKMDGENEVDQRMISLCDSEIYPHINNACPVTFEPILTPVV